MMKNSEMILAISSNGKEITVNECMSNMQLKDKTKLANFIYDRLYGRYLKPFDFPSQKYRLNYKNGFVLMASCCFLIETYVSFTKSEFRDTNRLSAKCFCYFFSSNKSFSLFAEGALKPDGSLANKTDGGIPNDFYENLRCGILHNGETKNGWKITRKSNTPYFDPASKTINAFKFANLLAKILQNYKKQLINSDFDNDEIWTNFKIRFNDLIITS
jgi:hypothetical protein